MNLKKKKEVKTVGFASNNLTPQSSRFSNQDGFLLTDDDSKTYSGDDHDDYEAHKTALIAPPNHQLIQSSENNLQSMIKRAGPETFILFLDPENRLYYRWFLSASGRCIKVETIEDQGLLAELDKRNLDVLFKIRKTLIIKDFSWNFKEAD